VIVDIGTGNGRAVLVRAAAEPASLVIGIDASAAAMADASRRADRRGPANALFLAVGVEALGTTPLAGRADLVTVLFPWGSLLRGALGLDDRAVCGVASLLGTGGRLEVLASVVTSDGVAGMDCLDMTEEPAILCAWSAAGLELVAMRLATAQDVAATDSTWARRLGAARGNRGDGDGRPVWRLEGRRSASIEG
jgi:16S rRNA (adenine(1408)-N(1))-methyltransferase